MVRRPWVRSAINAAAFSIAATVVGAFGVTTAASAGDRLVLTGSSTVAPLATEIGRRYEQLHPGVRIDVQTGGTARGVHDAREGLADIGMLSRALKESEHDLLGYTIALDGVAMVVHKQNPITTLTSQQIVDIFTGKVRDWSEVGPGSGRILVESKVEGRSSLEIFLDYFKLASHDIKADTLVGENEQAIKVIAGNPLAIGYVSIGAVIFEADNGTPVKLVQFDGMQPTIEAVATRKFPIVRELNLVVRRPPEGLVKDFIAFAQSESVDDLVKDLFFVPAR
jgi:phosphate transport system substrate-binding protein